jgi:phage terminase large subunit
MALDVALQPKQSELLSLIRNSPYKIIGYGGSNGGAKSHGIRDVNLVLCLEKKLSPIYTLIFRRKSNDLLENHIIPFFQKYPELNKFFNKTERIIYWPDGSITKFGYAEHEADITDFQGKKYDYIFIDEATHCTQPMIEFLLSRNRSETVRAKMILTMNPGNIGHTYIKRIFIDKKYLNNEDPDNYFYLPARIWDNVVWSEAALEEKGYTVEQYYEEWTEEQRKEFTLNFSDYAKTLAALPEMKMRAMLLGDWDVFEGQFFSEFWQDVHVINAEDYLSYDKIFSQTKILGGMDYGNDTFVYFAYRDYNGNVVIFDEFFDVRSARQVKIRDQKKFQKERKLLDTTIIADTNLWIKDAFDVEQSRAPADDYRDAGIKITKVSKTSTDQRGYRVQCWDAIKDALHWEQKDGKVTVQPSLKIYSRCRKLIEYLPTLVTDEKNVEDIADGQYDHPLDALKHVFMSIRIPRRPKENDLPEHLKKKINKKRILTVMSE